MLKRNRETASHDSGQKGHSNRAGPAGGTSVLSGLRRAAEGRGSRRSGGRLIAVVVVTVLNAVLPGGGRKSTGVRDRGRAASSRVGVVIGVAVVVVVTIAVEVVAVLNAVGSGWGGKSAGARDGSGRAVVVVLVVDFAIAMLMVAMLNTVGAVCGGLADGQIDSVG